MLKTRNDFSNERNLLSGIFVPCAIQSYTGGQQMLWLESQTLMLDDIKSADQQAGADEKKHGQGDFAGNQHGSQSTMSSSGGGCATFVFQNGVDIRSRCSERGGQTAQHRGKHRDT